MAGTVVGVFGVEASVFELRLFRSLSNVVTSCLSEMRCCFWGRGASEYFMPFVAMVEQLADSYAHLRW